MLCFDASVAKVEGRVPRIVLPPLGGRPRRGRPALENVKGSWSVSIKYAGLSLSIETQSFRRPLSMRYDFGRLSNTL